MPNKILILSDTHLSDKFDRSKFLFLKNLILSSGFVIINGDFWDFWSTDFDKFIKSPWQKLFPILKERKCVYIFGNHDPEEMSDSRIKAFSNISCNEYVFTTQSNEFAVCHGDKLVKNRSLFMNTYSSFLNKIEEKKIGKPFLKVFKKTEAFAYSAFGPNFMTNSRIGKRLNRNIKKYQIRNQNNRWLICGDTHTPEIDKENKYANTGCIVYGSGSYLLLEGKNVILRKEDYRNINYR